LRCFACASPFALAQSETDLLASLAFSQKHAPQRNTTYLELCLADTLLLQGRFAESLAKFEAHIPAAMTASLVRQGHEATSRKSRCLLALGRHDEALAAGEEALSGMAATLREHSMEITVHRDREFVLRALNRHAEADVHKALLDEAKDAIDAMRARYLERLMHALDPIHAKHANPVKTKR
jgi:tetratricopeptide (TPR) repeat protein